MTTYEFHRIDEEAPLPLLDDEDDNLLTSPTLPPQGLDPAREEIFDALYAELQSILTSEPTCPGDGNGDLLVNQEDVDNWRFFSGFTGQASSSWYDFNHDGLTNDLDLQVIEENLSADCRDGS